MSVTSAATVVPVAESMCAYWHNVATGVSSKVISTEGDETVGLLLLEPSAAIEAHAHEGEHHLYVLQGQCWFGDTLLSEGSYVHVPSRVRHTIHGAGPTGCRLLHLSTGTVA